MKKPTITLPKTIDPATLFIDYTHQGEEYKEASGKIAIIERMGALSFDFYRTEGPVSIYVDEKAQIEKLESGGWIIKINQKTNPELNIAICHECREPQNAHHPECYHADCDEDDMDVHGCGGKQKKNNL